MKLARCTVLALAALAPLGRADVCGACTPEKICGEHARADAERVGELRENFSEASKEQRVEALRDAARLTDAHADSPSREVAKLLGRALDDPDGLVCATAIELLGPVRARHVARVARAARGGDPREVTSA
jgi:DNA-binding LacI/PurR family transcriptional regulator